MIVLKIILSHIQSQNAQDRYSPETIMPRAKLFLVLRANFPSIIGPGQNAQGQFCPGHLYGLVVGIRCSGHSLPRAIYNEKNIKKNIVYMW